MGSNQTKPQPLAALFSSPRELLEKAQRDLHRLNDATIYGNAIGACDAMMDACISVFHVKDWIVAMCPDQKDAAEQFARESAWISCCRDICHASKHVALSLERKPYSETPPDVERVDTTAGPFAGTPDAVTILKVWSELCGNHHATVVIEKAIVDWAMFFANHKIR